MAVLTDTQISNLKFSSQVGAAMHGEANPVAADLLGRLMEIPSTTAAADIAAWDWDFAGTRMTTQNIAWLLRNMEASVETHAIGDLLADLIAPHVA